MLCLARGRLDPADGPLSRALQSLDLAGHRRSGGAGFCPARDRRAFARRRRWTAFPWL